MREIEIKIKISDLDDIQKNLKKKDAFFPAPSASAMLYIQKETARKNGKAQKRGTLSSACVFQKILPNSILSSKDLERWIILSMKRK